MISLDVRSLPPLSARQTQELEAQPPAIRGYWLDEELLTQAGIGSAAVLRRIQAAGWLSPQYVPMAGGGRRRAWTLREVAHAELLAQLARRTLIPLQSAAALLSGIGRHWIDEATAMEALLGEAAGDTPSPLPVSGTRLLLVDMTDAWIETSDGDFVLAASDMVLVGAANIFRTRSPLLPATREAGRASMDTLVEDAVVITIIALDAIPLASIEAAKKARRAAAVEEQRR